MRPICPSQNLHTIIPALLMWINVFGARPQKINLNTTTLWRLIMKEAKLRQDIIDEFEFDPSFDGERIGVAVDRNVVTLSGHVNSYAEKLAAIAAARRVKGVHAIAENIEVRYPYQSKTADDQIAERASDLLEWDVLVPNNSVDVLVHDGFVTLSGTVDWQYQRSAAEDDMRKLSGIVCVTNMIKIRPHVDASDIKTKIEAALKRHAEVEADAIRISIQNGNKVVLEGRVDNWDERYKVENAAWSSPGVTSVDDRLTIGAS
jgi:osmotically-inducible protein OsmY